MKKTTNSTEYILVKATTGSEWDNCQFAIIHISEGWKAQQLTRLEAVKPFANDNHFHSLQYYDTAVDFYADSLADDFDMGEMLGDQEWIYIELDPEETQELIRPESRLDGHRLLLHSAGTAYYSAYGKHTGEEFWTEAFNLGILCAPPATEITQRDQTVERRFKHLAPVQLNNDVK